MIQRWTPRRKAELLAQLDAGRVSFEELAQYWEISPEEIEEWRRLYAQDGLRGLRATRLQTYTGRTKLVRPYRRRE